MGLRQLEWSEEEGPHEAAEVRRGDVRAKDNAGQNTLLVTQRMWLKVARVIPARQLECLFPVPHPPPAS